MCYLIHHHYRSLNSTFQIFGRSLGTRPFAVTPPRSRRRHIMPARLPPRDCVPHGASPGPHLASAYGIIGGGTGGGGGGGGGGVRGGKRPHNILLGGPHTILVANGTIRRNAHTQPPVRSIIIHVDMIFCGKGTGRDSKGWPTIEYAMIDTAALRAK